MGNLPINYAYILKILSTDTIPDILPLLEMDKLLFQSPSDQYGKLNK